MGNVPRLPFTVHHILYFLLCTFYYYLSLIRENNPFIRNLFHKKVSLDLCSLFEINHSYLGIWAIEFVVGENVSDGISTIDEIIDNQYFEL